MTRIRYSRINGNLVSGLILCGSDMVTILISPSDMCYNIIAGNTGRSIGRGESNTLSRLKKLAKAHLKMLGSVFDDDVRNRI